MTHIVAGGLESLEKAGDGVIEFRGEELAVDEVAMQTATLFQQQHQHMTSPRVYPRPIQRKAVLQQRLQDLQ